MKTLILILLGLFNTILMLAQTNNPPAGEYYLEGVRETASGFKLNIDNSFEFFFSQGALDRYGKGHYKVTCDSIIFTSDSIKTNDFTLLTSKSQPGKSTVVKIETNKNLMPYIYVRIKSGTDSKDGNIDNNGYFKYDGNKPDTIQLAFEFCPEKLGSFAAINHNYFEFKIEPWLFEYFFKDFSLKWSGNELSGGHPLLQGTEFTYGKNQ